MLKTVSRIVNAIRHRVPFVLNAMPASLREARKQPRLLILDDLFPSLVSGFRIAEYHTYLKVFPSSEIYSSGDMATFANGAKSYQDALRLYRKAFPETGDRIRRFNPLVRMNASLFYTMFVANGLRFLSYVSRHQSKMILTIYPGGGFFLDNKECDDNLRKLFQSHQLVKAIVTQRVTFDYLLSKNLCSPERLVFIWGCAILPDDSETRTFPSDDAPDKPFVDICFVAHKYMRGGKDKGYDVFLETARLIVRGNPRARIHVVGGYDSADGHIAGLERCIHFHGCLENAALGVFLRRMDAIISPNAPFLLGPGRFDGFPTGACTHAGLAGVAVFACDMLRENTTFRDGVDIVIISRKPDEIADVVLYYINDPSRLVKLQRNCQEAFRRLYSYETQLAPRVSLLELHGAGSLVRQ